jgi:uncharacterized membrane protein
MPFIDLLISTLLQAGPVAAIGASAYMLWVGTKNLQRMLNIFYHTRIHSIIDQAEPVAQDAIEPPTRLLEAQLLALGFHEHHLMRFHFKASLGTGYSWLYTHASGAAYAGITFSSFVPVIVELVTVYQDDAMLVTTYPVGETIFTTMFVSQFARGSVEAAWNYHQQQITTGRVAHKGIVPQQSSEAVSKTMALFTNRYRRLQQRRLIIFDAIAILLTMLLMAFCVAVILTALSRLYAHMTILIIATILGAGLTNLYARWYGSQLLHPTGALDDP